MYQNKCFSSLTSWMNLNLPSWGGGVLHLRAHSWVHPEEKERPEPGWLPATCTHDMTPALEAPQHEHVNEGLKDSPGARVSGGLLWGTM